jgi:hypothetical protein
MAKTGQSAFLLLANQFKQAALGFTHVNVRNWYAPGEPMLLELPAAFFILGLIVLLFKFRRPLFQWLFLWLGSAITISALSESTPAAQRLTIVAPVVVILVTLPLVSVIDWISNSIPERKNLVFTLIASLLALIIVGDMNFYFRQYSANRTFGDTNTEVAQEVADLLNTLGGSPTVYFFGLPRMGYYTHSTIQYLAPHASGEDIVDPLQEPPSSLTNKNAVYIFLPERMDELAYVRAANPGGEEHQILGRNNEHLFSTYLVPPSSE